MMNRKAMPVSLLALAIVLVWAISAPADARSLVPGTAPALRSVSVNPVQDFPLNVAPTADNQNVNVVEDTATLITLTGSDPDVGDTLTFSIVTPPTHGLLSGSGASQTYTPALNYNGPDSFTFQIFDGTDTSNVATVSITVTAVNDPPTANSQNVNVVEDTPTPITLTGSDPDGDTLTFTIVTPPVNGTLSGTGANRTYTPNSNFNGPDNFTFKVSDGTLESAAATVSITVTPVNDAPTANPQNVNVIEDTATSITLTGSDPDGNALTFTIVTPPVNGTLSGTGANRTYTPNLNYNGPDSFTFKVNDGTLDSDTAEVKITVTPVNDPPTATPQNINVVEDTATPITLSGSDPENATLSFIVVTQPTHGSLSGTGAVRTYTPNSNFNGSDSFIFKVNDGTTDSNEATVSITVTPVNDPPTLDLDSGSAGTGFSTTHSAGKTAVKIAGNLTITDLDNTGLMSATVKITNMKHPDKEVLDAAVTGDITKSYDDQTGVLTLTGEASIADYQTVLKSVTYLVQPDVTSPNTTERSIEVVVYDGEASSNTAVSTVKIIAPRIAITATAQAPILKGGDVTFTVTVTNPAGSNVNLKEIAVTSPTQPPQPGNTCSKIWLDELAPDDSRSFDCKAFAIQAGYSHKFEVTAKDAEPGFGSVVSASTEAWVDVGLVILVQIDPNNNVTTLMKGENAGFQIVIKNPQGTNLAKVSTTATIQYYDVGTGIYSDPVVAPGDCSRPSLGTIAANQEEKKYNCSIPAVTTSFRLIIEAQGEPPNSVFKTDSAEVEISVIDLALEATADPAVVNVGTPTLVTFNVSLHNRSSETVTLTSLTSDQHGDLLVAGLTDNTCPGIIKAMGKNEVRTCSYKQELTVDSSRYANTITAGASYGTSPNTKLFTVTDEAAVSVPLDVELTANPSHLVAPGGPTTLTVQVTNNTTSNLTINKLTDEVSGDLNGVGSCQTPEVLIAGESYTCAYPITISGKVVGDVVSRKVTAQTTENVTASDTVDINIIDTIHVMLPAVTKLSLFGEPYNSACKAMPITPQISYFGLPDDNWDFYRITLTAPSYLKASIKNFMVGEPGGVNAGQLVIYGGVDCEHLVAKGNNGEAGLVPNRVVSLAEVQAQGTYYIAVYVSKGEYFNNKDIYELNVQVTAP